MRPVGSGTGPLVPGSLPVLGRVVFRVAELVILRHCSVEPVQFVVGEVVECCMVLGVVQLPLWPLTSRAGFVQGKVLDAISSIGDKWDCVLRRRLRHCGVSIGTPPEGAGMVAALAAAV